MANPYEEFASRALGWLSDHLDCFEPYQGGKKPSQLRQKALTEIALLCLCLRHSPTFRDDARLQTFVEFLRDVNASPRFRDRLFSIRIAFVRHLAVVVALRCHQVVGHDDDWDAVQWLLDRGNILASERAGHGLLELRYLLDLGGLRHNLPTYAESCDRSIIARHINVLYMTDDDAYSLTHDLFYLGDFGRRPISELSPSQRMQLTLVVSQLLGMYSRIRNWDLVSELLVSSHCLGCTTSRPFVLSWKAMMVDQWPCGRVVGPYFRSAKADELTGAEKRNYIFESCYHTTLVAALAGATCPYATGVKKEFSPEDI